MELVNTKMKPAYAIALSIVVLSVTFWAIGTSAQRQYEHDLKLKAYYKLHPTPAPTPTPSPTPTPALTVEDQILLAGRKECRDDDKTTSDSVDDYTIIGIDRHDFANHGHVKVRCGLIVTIKDSLGRPVRYSSDTKATEDIYLYGETPK